MTKKNNSKKYIIGLLVAWLLGCIFQYLFCCKAKVSKMATAVVPAVVASKVVADGTDTDKVATDSATTESATEVVVEVPEVTENPFEVSGEDLNIELGSEDNFNFLANQEKPVLPASEGLQNNSKQLVDYLANNTDKKLTVTGLYRTDEEDTSTFENLGLARAEQIKGYLVEQGANADQIAIAGQVDDQAVGDKDGKYLGRADFTVEKVAEVQTEEPQSEPVAEPAPVVEPAPVAETVEPVAEPVVAPTTNAFAVSGDGISLDLASEDNFNFLPNQEKPVLPVSEGLQNNSKQLVDYLGDNASERLTVTGLYRTDEENTSIFPDLGLARANQVKSYLVEQGAKAQQIEIASQVDDKAVADKEGKYLGRTNFDVVKVDNVAQQKYDAEMQQLADKIKANPVTVYFATGNSKVKLDAKQREIIFDMIRYLDFDATAKVDVTGHTDNVGNAAANTKLGKKRATFVADYLVGKGLKKDRMNISSEGPNKPIADNATAEGRAKNRRVTVSMTNEKVN